jgi:hypothetical protein
MPTARRGKILQKNSRIRTSGAKAPIHFEGRNGTSELVPFPFVMNADR